MFELVIKKPDFCGLKAYPLNIFFVARPILGYKELSRNIQYVFFSHCKSIELFFTRRVFEVQNSSPFRFFSHDLSVLRTSSSCESKTHSGGVQGDQIRTCDILYVSPMLDLWPLFDVGPVSTSNIKKWLISARHPFGPGALVRAPPALRAATLLTRAAAAISPKF